MLGYSTQWGTFVVLTLKPADKISNIKCYQLLNWYSMHSGTSELRISDLQRLQLTTKNEVYCLLGIGKGSLRLA